jgi:hypothetical protein
LSTAIQGRSQRWVREKKKKKKQEKKEEIPHASPSQHCSIYQSVWQEHRISLSVYEASTPFPGNALRLARGSARPSEIMILEVGCWVN